MAFVRPSRLRTGRGLSLTALVSTGIVAAAMAFILSQLHPGDIVSSTTPAGGDMGAHVWAPAFLRDHLLPDWRLSGWTPDWYAGFPAYQFYMVVPSLAIVALDLVMSYEVAFKLVTVSGLVSLPLATFAFGRLARIPFPGPALLAVASAAYVFDRSFTIYGGNVASTMAGEFAFSISLSLAVLFVGLVLRGLDTGRLRALAAVVLGLCTLCHLIPAIFALVAAGVALAMRPGAARLRWILSSVVVGGLLTSFWTVPFLLRRPYLNDMGWNKLPNAGETSWEYLFPGRIGDWLSRLAGADGSRADIAGDMTWVVLLAVAGAIVSIALRRRPGIFLTVLGLVFAVAFVLVPQGRLWNARLLPFWYLCLYLLAALAVAELVAAVATLVARDPSQPSLRALAGGAVAATVLALAVVAYPLRALPFGDESSDGISYSWAGIESTDRNFVSSWARWNFSGYEKKEAWPEYEAVVSTMADVGRDHGCGRAMWEYEPDLNRYGTPMALMLLPYWTDGCIGSMEGLYFEASATTPYHFLNQSELSVTPSRAQRELPYGSLDIERGVEHLQLLGVRYYMAFSDQAVRQAGDHPDLTPVATSGPWHVFEIADSPLVQPLDAEPAVLDGVDKGGKTWLDPAVAWYLQRPRSEVMLAADGPSSWARVENAKDARTRPVPQTTVTDVETTTDSISFSVSRPGTPVLVKTSYFPNWKAEGADGPYRVTPNLMVVVPTGEHVELSYGFTPVDVLAWILTGIGIVGLVVLVRLGPVQMPEQRRRARAAGRSPDEVAAEIELLLLDGDAPAREEDGTIAPLGDQDGDQDSRAAPSGDQDSGAAPAGGRSGSLPGP